jgi:hypothetical protein
VQSNSPHSVRWGALMSTPGSIAARRSRTGLRPARPTAACGRRTRRIARTHTPGDPWQLILGHASAGEKRDQARNWTLSSIFAAAWSADALMQSHDYASKFRNPRRFRG